MRCRIPQANKGTGMVCIYIDSKITVSKETVIDI